MNYYEVLVCKVHSSRQFFTYQSDETLVPGQVVFSMFGKKLVAAIVINKVKKPTFKTISIKTVLLYKLPCSSLNLLNWMLEYYPDDYGSIGSLFLPPNLDVKSRSNLSAKIVHGLNKPLPKATSEQKLAINQIAEASKNLLLGVTGSGKTRVFTSQILETIKAGKSVFVLTPEIGLTPQLLAEIQSHTNCPIVVSHSLINPAEKKRIWEYTVSEHPPTIYIGPRSVLFVPESNLGLIVVDEFHDQSFNQQSSPRYNSLHIVAKLSQITSSKIIASSATPNVADYYLMKRAGYQIAELKSLAVAQIPATSQIVDTSDRSLFTTNKYLSDPAIEAIKLCLKNDEQVLIFLNRRGTARLVQCASCGWQATCKTCGLPMTYHHDFFQLLCHSCGTKQAAPKKCPECGSVDIAYKSVGTKTLVEQLQKMFPKSKIARFDADNKAVDKLHRNINDLKTNQVDIIVGTQLITKGIDLPHLSLVVVVNADSSLALPDYTAEEQLFSQLYQVTGRVGRGHRASSYIIQTKNPTHPVIEAVTKRNYSEFYNYEIKKRELFNYPPFCFLAIVKVTKKTEQKAEQAAQKIANLLTEFTDINILGPSPSFYEKSAKGYTWQLIIKSARRSSILEAAKNISGSDVTVELDPVSLL